MILKVSSNPNHATILLQNNSTLAHGCAYEWETNPCGSKISSCSATSSANGNRPDFRDFHRAVISEIFSHRMVGLAGTLKPIHTYSLLRAGLPLTRSAQGPIQPLRMEPPQLSGQPVSVPHCSLSNSFPPKV